MFGGGTLASPSWSFAPTDILAGVFPFTNQDTYWRAASVSRHRSAVARRADASPSVRMSIFSLGRAVKELTARDAQLHVRKLFVDRHDSRSLCCPGESHLPHCVSLGHVVRAFPRLRELRIHALCPSWVTSDLTGLAGLAPTLESLSVFGWFGYKCIRRAMSHTPFAHLRRLNVLDSGVWIGALAFFAKQLPALEFLGCRGIVVSDAVFCADPDVAPSFARLHTLKTDGVWCWQVAGDARRVDMTVDSQDMTVWFLKRIAPRLQRLELTLETYNGASEDYFNASIAIYARLPTVTTISLAAPINATRLARFLETVQPNVTELDLAQCYPVPADGGAHLHTTVAGLLKVIAAALPRLECLQRLQLPRFASPNALSDASSDAFFDAFLESRHLVVNGRRWKQLL